MRTKWTRRTCVALRVMKKPFGPQAPAATGGPLASASAKPSRSSSSWGNPPNEKKGIPKKKCPAAETEQIPKTTHSKVVTVREWVWSFPGTMNQTLKVFSIFVKITSHFRWIFVSPAGFPLEPRNLAPSLLPDDPNQSGCPSGWRWEFPKNDPNRWGFRECTL